jgi:hypothetical protein
VTLPEVVTGELAGKFGEISLFDHHADFELGSASNSSSRPRGPSYASWLLIHRMRTPHPASASHVAPQRQQGPHEGSHYASGRQGARTQVRLEL